MNLDLFLFWKKVLVFYIFTGAGYEEPQSNECLPVNQVTMLQNFSLNNEPK